MKEKEEPDEKASKQVGFRKDWHDIKWVLTAGALGGLAAWGYGLVLGDPSPGGMWAVPAAVFLGAFAAGIGDYKIMTTLCPGGKERMRRLMAMIEHHRVDLSPLVTHRFALDDIEEAYGLFSEQREGVLKVAVYLDRMRMPAAARTVADTLVEALS